MGGHRTPRIIRRVIVFLLLIVGGAIVNVAVAWGCAMRAPMDATWVYARIRPQAAWQPLDELDHGRKGFLYVSQWRRFGSTCVDVAAGQFQHGPRDVPRGLPLNHCPTWCREHVLASMAASERTVLTIEGRGWPFRALWCEPAEANVFGTGVDPPLGGIDIDGRFAAPSDRFTRPTLPLFTIPFGFAINTLFYAVILLVLFAAPFALRRRRRIKRGLCPACAYPVGDSPVCTECGRAHSQ